MRWKKIRNKAAAPLLYSAFFFLALYLFVVSGIDGDALAMKLEAAAARYGGVVVAIDHAGISPPASLKLKGITIKDDAGTKLRFDNLKARLLLLKLFTGRLGLRITTYAQNGNFLLDISTPILGKGKLRVGFNGRDFPIQEIVDSVAGSDLPLHGELSVDGELELPGATASPLDSTGQLTLSMKKIVIKKSVIGEGLIRKITPEKFSCDVTVEKRTIKTGDCEAVTAAGRLELRLSSRFANSLARTQLRGTVIVTPTGDSLKKLLAIYSKRQRPDGRYHFPLKGTFANPRIDL